MVSDLYDYPELYDALLPVGAHLPFYLDLARQHAGGVLELACGTGQLAVPIAAAGLPTLGLDRSAAMLAGARRRAEVFGVALELVEGDMRDFDLGRRFGTSPISTHLTDGSCRWWFEAFFRRSFRCCSRLVAFT